MPNYAGIKPPTFFTKEEMAEARKIKPSLEDVFVEITGIETDTMRGEKNKKGGGP
jgi:hypothetical protein